MKDSILNFAEEFKYQPEIINSDNLKEYKHIILAGMGGSHLAGDTIKAIKPGIDIYIHKDYDLPPYGDTFFKEGLLVVSSHSGNTEETLSFLNKALEKGYGVIIISSGGKILEIAKENNLPYIELPKVNIQPRVAIGYVMAALAHVLKNEELINNIAELANILKPESLMDKGEELANEISRYIPVVYTSTRNLTIAYNWKIKLNETGKIPAFYNIFPELNHNEIQGYHSELSKNICPIFVFDSEDDRRIDKRMIVMKKQLDDMGVKTIRVDIDGDTRQERILNSILLADWVAYFTAIKNGDDPEEVAMIEDFKKELNK